MFPPIPQNCTVIETPLSHLVPVDDMGTVEEKPVYRCIPKLESNVIRLYALGNTSKVSYRPVCIAPGVDTHAIHDFNVSSGWTLPDERTEEERAAESIRTSISRSVRLVRELAACNPWQFFVTITLSPEHCQNRYTPDGLQDVIKQLAKRWRRKHKNRSAYCPDFKYLFVPEMHKNGAIHLHGFVSCMPSDCIPYTLEQVSGSQRLPKKICDKVRAGQPVYHCQEWENLFGFNTLEPISDLDKASSYAVKYVSKELGSTPFKTRYWCSRGLSRASLITTVYFDRRHDTDSQFCIYRRYMTSIAAVTKSNHLMHEERYAPVLDRSHLPTDVNRLTVITTYINGIDHTSSEIRKFLESNFDTTPNYVRVSNDAVTIEQVISDTKANIRIHKLAVKKQKEHEDEELLHLEKAGRIVYIDSLPFTLIPDDDPICKLFDAPSNIPAPPPPKCTQLSIFDNLKEKGCFLYNVEKLS